MLMRLHAIRTSSAGATQHTLFDLDRTIVSNMGGANDPREPGVGHLLTETWVDTPT